MSILIHHNWNNGQYLVSNVQYCRNPIDHYKLEVKALEPKNQKRIYDKQIIDLDFGDTPVKLKEELFRCI